MLGGELEPGGRSGPDLAGVAAEMGEIFDQAGLSPSPPDGRAPAVVAPLRPSRSSGPATALLIGAVAGVLGFGAGALVFRAHVFRAHERPAPVAAKIAAQARPQPRPSQPESQPQVQPPVTPPIALAEASTPPAVAQAPPAPKASSPAQASPSVRVPSSAARSRAEFRLKLARLGGPKPAQARPPIRLAAPRAQPASCEQDEGSEDCRRAVIQADRHLRAVFQGALERGVSRRVLVSYRDRWADLRERNSNDPVRLIESYGGLAYDLGRETAAEHDDAPRSRDLADLLPPG